MGGLGSGRRRNHVCMTDCLTLDTMAMNRRHMFAANDNKPRVYTMSWKIWRETNFQKRTETEHHVSAFVMMGERPRVVFGYAVGSETPGGMQHQAYREEVVLESSACHYGGVRWWFRCPGCAQRVRVLYLNTRGDSEQIRPQCRECNRIHYASQCASYIERHITYEKHLLSNFGYYWAANAYHCLKEHYFPISDEYFYKARRSELERERVLLTHLIATERLLLRTHARVLDSIKLEEEREIYLAHLLKEHGQQHALDVVALLKHSIFLERSIREISNSVMDRLCHWEPVLHDQDEGEQEEAPHRTYLADVPLGKMLLLKQSLEDELEAMEKQAA